MLARAGFVLRTTPKPTLPATHTATQAVYTSRVAVATTGSVGGATPRLFPALCRSLSSSAAGIPTDTTATTTVATTETDANTNSTETSSNNSNNNTRPRRPKHRVPLPTPQYYELPADASVEERAVHDEAVRVLTTTNVAERELSFAHRAVREGTLHGVTAGMLIRALGSQPRHYNKQLRLFAAILDSDTPRTEDLFRPTILAACVKRDWRSVGLVFDEWVASGVPFTADVVSEVIGCLGRAQQFRELIRVFLTVHDTVDVTGSLCSVESYSHAVRALAKTGRYREAMTLVSTFEQAHAAATLPPATFSALIAAAGKQKPPDGPGILRLIDGLEASGVSVNVYTYTNAVVGLSRAGRINDALSMLDRMAAAGVPPALPTYSVVMSALSRIRGRADDVNALLEKAVAAGVQPDSVMYTSVIHAAGLQEGPTAALAVVDDMRAAGVEPDLNTYHALLNLFGELGSVDGLHAAFGMLRESGLPLSYVQYSTVLSALAKAGGPEDMEAVFSEAIEGGHAHKVLFNRMMSAYGAAGDGEGVLRVFGLASAATAQDLPLFNVAIGALIEAGDLEHALGMARELRNSGFKPDLYTYSLLIKLYGATGDVSSVKKVLAGLRTAGLRPNNYIYNSMLDAFSKAGAVADAEETVAQMRADGARPDVICYNTLLDAYARSVPKTTTLESKRAVASRLLGVVEAMRRDGVAPDRYTFCTLVASAGKLGERDLVHRFVDRMKGETVVDAFGYETALTAFARVGDVSAAERVFEEMKAAGQPLHSRVYHTLLSLYAEDSDIDSMKEVVESMTRNGLALDAAVFHSLIRTYLRAGDTDAGESLVREMEGHGVEPTEMTYAMLLRGYARSGSVEKVSSVIEDMRSAGVGLNNYAYAAVLEAYSRAGDKEKVASVQAEYLESSAVEPSMLTHGALAVALKYCDLTTEAEDVVHEMASLPLPETSSEMGAVMLSLSRLGYSRRVIELGQHMQATNMHIQPFHFELLRQAYAELGDTEGTATLDRLRDSVIQAEMSATSQDDAMEHPEFQRLAAIGGETVTLEPLLAEVLGSTRTPAQEGVKATPFSVGGGRGGAGSAAEYSTVAGGHEEIRWDA